MKLSQETLSGLKRHFLGALSAPSPVWLVPAPGPRLLFTGRGALGSGPDGCTVEYGTVDSPGRERRILRVANLGMETVMLTVEDRPAWLAVRWPGLGESGGSAVLTPGDPGAELELVIEHDEVEETVFDDTVRLRIEPLSGESTNETLRVRLATRRTHPLGRYGFQGEAEPRPWDFGVLDPGASNPETLASYRLSFENRTSVPLQVSFADLPAWLVFEVDGYLRRGPAAGRFFERAAPFEVEIRPVCTPQFLGRQVGTVRLRTNDERPSFQAVDLDFSARIEPSRAYVKVRSSDRARVRAGESCQVEVGLENQGRSPARLILQHQDPALQLSGRPPVVPEAQDGKPGRAVLAVQVSARVLAPGLHAPVLTFRVEDGQRPEVEVPVPLHVVAAVPLPEPVAVPPPPAQRLGPGLAVAALGLVLLLLALFAFAEVFQ